MRSMLEKLYEAFVNDRDSESVASEDELEVKKILNFSYEELERTLGEEQRKLLCSFVDLYGKRFSEEACKAYKSGVKEGFRLAAEIYGDKE